MEKVEKLTKEQEDKVLLYLEKYYNRVYKTSPVKKEFDQPIFES